MPYEPKKPFTPSPRNFKLMVVGQIISILGSALLRFALALYVLDTTGSESMFATLYAISNIPLLLAPLGGAIADRFNRRNLMVVFDFASGMIVLCLILLMGTGNASIITIGIVMALLSAVGALYTPAVTASIPLLVTSDHLEGANGIVQAVQALSTVAAPILGGVLYGMMGVQAVTALSCISFFLSAVMEIFIKIPFEKREQAGSIIPAIANDIIDGFAYVMKQRFIRKVGAIAVLTNLVLTPYFLVGVPIVLRVTMQSSETDYGAGMALVNFATILGALSVGYVSKRMTLQSLYRWIIAAALLMAPMAWSLLPFMLGLGYYPSFILFMTSAIPIAAGVTIISIYVITKIQKVTPNENLGKVMAIIMAVAQCAAPVGQIMCGILFEIWSAQAFLPTIIVGAATLLLGFLTRHMLKNEEEFEK